MTTKTVREWIDFLNSDGVLFGIKSAEDTYTTLPLDKYFSSDFIFANDIFDDVLEKVVVHAYPMNLIQDGKTYCLLKIKNW